MDFFYVFSHVYKFIESLYKKLQIHIDSNGEVLFCNRWHQVLKFVFCSFSLSTWWLVTSFFQLLSQLTLEVLEVHETHLDFVLDAILCFISIQNITHLAGFNIHNISLSLLIKWDSMKVFNGFHDLVISCFSTRDDLDFILKFFQWHNDIRCNIFNSECLLDMYILLDDIIS